MADSRSFDSIEKWVTFFVLSKRHTHKKLWFRIREQLRLISKQKDIIDQIQQVLESWNYKSIQSVAIFIDDIERAVEDLITLLFDNNDCHNCKIIPDLIKAYETYTNSAEIPKKFLFLVLCIFRSTTLYFHAWKTNIPTKIYTPTKELKSFAKKMVHQSN